MLYYNITSPLQLQLDLGIEKSKFKPKFLHKLVYYLYDDKPEIIRQHELEQILVDAHGKGNFWEQVLAKGMPHTTILERNAHHRDYADNSDAKFCMVGNYNDSIQKQATISGTRNKIGPLRVCMCFKGQKVHKVYFMLIPHEVHSKLKGENIKITFDGDRPIGALWNKYQCSFEEVTRKI